MATEVGRIYYDLDLDDSKFQAGIDKASAKAKSFANSLGNDLQKIGQGFYNIGKKMTIGLTLPLVAGMGFMVKGASDLVEIINKVDVAFKDQSDRVKDWGNTTLTTFGMAKATALDVAANFGDMATSMGLNTGQAADMSMALTGLAGDLASFKNIRFDVAKTALTGIFTGETESLKQLGIIMTEQNIKQFLMNKGVTKSWNEMSQAEKVQWRYKYVLEKTKNAQGDFAKTSDSTANQLRVIQERTKELSAKLGNRLLPYVNKILKKLNDWGKAFSKLTPKQQDMILKIAGMVAVLGPALYIIGKITSAVGLLIKIIAFFGTTVGIYVGAALLVIAALAFLAYEVYKNWDMVKGWFIAFWQVLQEGISVIVQFFVTAWNMILAVVKGVVQGIINIISSILSTIGNIIWTFFGPIIILFFVILETVYNVFMWLLNGVIVIFKWMWNGIVVIMSPIIRFFSGIAQGIWGGIKWAVDKLVGAFSSAWNTIKNVWKGVTGFFSGLWDGIKQGVRKITEIILSPFKRAFNAIADAWNNTVGSIGFTVPDWAPGLGGKGWNMPKMPKLAQGTDFFPGGMAIVGERGPEEVYLPRGSKVVPNGKTGGIVIERIDMSGIVATSPSEFRALGIKFIESVNEELRAKGRQELGGSNA